MVIDAVARFLAHGLRPKPDDLQTSDVIDAREVFYEVRKSVIRERARKVEKHSSSRKPAQKQKPVRAADEPFQRTAGYSWIKFGKVPGLFGIINQSALPEAFPEDEPPLSPSPVAA